MIFRKNILEIRKEYKDLKIKNIQKVFTMF